MEKIEYDGFYFLPGEEDDDLNLAFFKFNEDTDYGKPIESSHMGDKFHIAFFKQDEYGFPFFDEQFEAIFADPEVYIKNFTGSRMYGCMLRKTEKSDIWWKEYIDKAIKNCKILRKEAEEQAEKLKK